MAERKPDKKIKVRKVFTCLSQQHVLDVWNGSEGSPFCPSSKLLELESLIQAQRGRVQGSTGNVCMGLPWIISSFVLACYIHHNIGVILLIVPEP